MIKAILFDMDGVLVDAKEWHYHALNDALLRYNQHISLEDHLTRFDGLPTKTKLDILTQERGLDANLHNSINSLKQDITIEKFQENISPDQKQIQMLNDLRDNGYKICLCSNSKSKTIEIFLEESQTKEYFNFFLSNEDVKNPKPHPEIYNKAINKFGFKPEECLIIEDNFNGIKAAKASGAHVLEIKEISETNYTNILNKINQLNNHNDQ